MPTSTASPESNHYVEVHTPKYQAHVPQVTLEWRDIGLSTTFKNSRTKQLEDKMILHGVSGRAEPGQLLALMGPSGAGKSSLLDCISGRTKVTAGTVSVNGSPWSTSLKRLASYVVQDDLFYETISVQEHLTFQARLRMGKSATHEEQQQRVMSVMEELGLTKCRDSLVGGQRIRGISGGERKRLSFATEILTNPSLLFVDEPTSGLDSFMAESVVAQLRQLAQDGRTVIVTIHQPSSAIFALFDQLYLLVDGSVAFHGRASDAVPYFAAMGFHCPSFVNAADYFMQQLVVMDRDSDLEGVKRVQRIKTEWATRQETSTVKQLSSQSTPMATLDTTPAAAATATTSSNRLSILAQTRVLCARNAVRLVRDHVAFRALAFEAVFISMIIGSIFFQLELHQQGVQNFAGVMFFMVLNLTFSACNPTFVSVPTELPLIVREYRAGLYNLGAWYFAKNVSELPLQVLFPMLFFVPSYLMVGFGHGFGVYVSMQVFIILVYSASIGLGYMIACLCRRVETAPIIGGAAVLPFVLIGGLFLNAANLPKHIAWLQYISPVKYSFEGVMKVFWSQVDTIPCNELVERCIAQTGKEVLQYYSMESRSAWGDALLLVIINIGFRCAGFLALWWHFRKAHRS